MEKLLESMTGDHPGAPCLVLSNDAGAGGLAKAHGKGVPTEVVSHRPFGTDRQRFEEALTAAITPHKPDLICLAGFMRKLTSGFVDQWQGRMLNIHPSLLPKYRGLNTHARALEAGDTEHGCTVHEVTPVLDDGPILGQARLQVMPDDTAESLAARVLELEHRLYPTILRRFMLGEKEPLFLQE